jgi:hypothetical protein
VIISSTIPTCLSSYVVISLTMTTTAIITNDVIRSPRALSVFIVGTTI